MGIILSANTNQFIGDLMNGTTFNSGVTELLSPNGPFTMEDLRESVDIQTKIDNGDISLIFNNKLILDVKSVGIDTILTFGDGTTFPKPMIENVVNGVINSGITNTVTVNGSYFTESTTVLVPPMVINNINIINDHSLTFEISGNTLGLYDIIVTSQGGSTIISDGIEIITSTWIDLRLGGDQFTDGVNAGNDIRYRSGMSLARDTNGMFFSGLNPWSSWVKFESLGWSRGDNKTIEWIFSTPQNAMMIGIGSDQTNEGSSAQYGQAECQAYFNSATSLWGLYGNNGTLGNSQGQSISANITINSYFKIKFENDGSVGEVFTLYQLPSNNTSDWDDENNVLTSGVIGNGSTLSPSQTNIMPFITPRNGGNQRFIAIKIS